MRGSAQFAADLSLCGRSECCGPSVLNVCPFAGMAPKKSKAAAGDVVTIIEKAPENPNVEIQAEVEAAMQAIMGHHVFANVVNETPLGVGDAHGFQAGSSCPRLLRTARDRGCW